ncbi:DUF2815 family protein [uncultured Romboutsia sp.]|uniref:DUF2815 family protein n=1 Tax=uncultured Romboutsia sp. TaxID=1505656 RepID=UPI00266C97FF|nr:DUF2815 family protein [uncultured Romboutsia sp.]
MKLNTKVVTGSVKLNYVNIKEARSNALSSEPKYSITIIIHKESNTMDKIYEGIYNATKNGLDIWDGKVPDNLKDGDATGRKEYEDSFYIHATSKYRPQVVDKDLKILSPDELYNGCLGRVSINFYPYNHKESGNCGISCELLNLQKLKDGEKIVNRASAVDDFSVAYDDGILV